MSLLSSLLVFLLAAAEPSEAAQNEVFPPHRVADNLYYVGSKQLSSYLVTTPKGHILINSSFESTVPVIKAAVEKLGFKFGDIKILLASHAHNDHVAGSALVRELTGAKVYAMRGDAEVISSGGKGQYMYKHTWRPCPVDKVLSDGDKVTLGGVTLTAHLTPGHTRGNTTWTMKALDKGKTYDVVIVGSPNINDGYRLVGNFDYPTIAIDYEKAFKVWKSLPCDIFLGAHGKYYNLEEKYPRLAAGDKNPFIDPAGYKAYIAEREENFRKTRAAQSMPDAEQRRN